MRSRLVMILAVALAALASAGSALRLSLIHI